MKGGGCRWRWVAGWSLLTGVLAMLHGAPKEVPHPVAPGQPAVEAAVETVAGGRELSPQLVKEYFQHKPASFLVDPQHLLTKRTHDERQSFLKYHAGDSAIDLYVLLFRSGQELPPDIDLEQVAGRFFSGGRPAVLVCYFLGEPSRAVMSVGPVLGRQVSEDSRRRAIERSVAVAVTHPDPETQFERFLVQMTIRLYWMERELRGDSPKGGGFDLAMDHEAPKVKESRMQHYKDLAWQWRRLLMAGLGGLVGFLVLKLVHWMWRRWSRHQVPMWEVAPRLGAPHGAGVGARISFANPSKPPSSQRPGPVDPVAGL